MFSRRKPAPKPEEDVFQDAPDDTSIKGDSASISRYSQGASSDAAAAGGSGGGLLGPSSVRTLSALQATFLAGLAAFSWAVACSGTCLLIWLLVSRMYLPTAIEWDRPLYFDYGTSLSTAFALVPLTHDPDAAPGGVLADPSEIPGGGSSSSSGGGSDGGWADEYPLLSDAGGAAGGAALPGAALLMSPGRRAAVSVRLRLPPPRDQDMFQVTGELLTADGRLLGRAARTHVPRPRAFVPRWVHWIITAPWAAIGLYDDSEHVELLLFENYGVPGGRALSRRPSRGRSRRGSSESGDGAAPSEAELQAAALVPAYFRAKLVGRSPADGPPRIYSADMHLKLHLGWIESFLFHLNPGPLLALVLLASGVAMALGGSGAAGAALIAAVAVFRWGSRVADRVARTQREREAAAAAARGRGGAGYGSAGGSLYGPEGDEDSLSGQWTPVYGGAAAASKAGGIRGVGGGGRGYLEPASPYEDLASGRGGGPAVAAIRQALSGRQRGGGSEGDGEEEGDEGGDAFADAQQGETDEDAGQGESGGSRESWQHIVAGSESGGSGSGIPMHSAAAAGAAAVTRRRGWRLRA